MRPLLCPLLLLLLAAPAIGVHAQPLDATDITIAADTTWTGEVRTIPHDLIVAAPATLRLEGTRLLVGNRILVESGARLELHPHGQDPTDIGPLGPGPYTTYNGVWLHVNGTLASSGLPATQIHGLRGSGIYGVYSEGPWAGGIQVFGRADLADVHIHDGNGTLAVEPTGTARLAGARIEGMAEVGLAVRGALEIEDTVLAGSSIGLAGFATCAIHARNLQVDAPREALLINSCALDLRDSRITAGIGIYTSGDATVNVTDTRISGYGAHGIHAGSIPGKAKHRDGLLQPHLTLDGVRLEPEPGVNTTVGVWMQGAWLTLRNSRIEGNGQDGIQATQGGALAVSNSTIVRNGGFGISARTLQLAGDLLPGNDLGSPGAGTQNAKGQIEASVRIASTVLDAANHTLSGSSLVIIASGNTTPAAAAPAVLAGFALASFDVYKQLPDGTSRFLGPFTYYVQQPSLKAPVQGTVDLSQPVVIVRVPPAAAEAAALPLQQDFGKWALLGAGGGLIVLGVLWKPLTRWFRNRKGSHPEVTPPPPAAPEPPAADLAGDAE